MPVKSELKDKLEQAKYYEGLFKDDPTDANEANWATSLNHLAVEYSAAKKGAKAQKTAQQAIDIFQRLVEKDADTHEWSLAVSFASLGGIYLSEENLPEAQISLHSGIAVLKRLFLKTPETHAEMMLHIVLPYTKVCEALNQHPDMELLDTVLDELQKFE